MRQKGEKLGSNGHYLIDPWAAANMNQATEHSLTTLPAARPWPGANQLRAPPLLPVLICNQTASKSSKAGKFENNKQLKRQIFCDAALTFSWPYKLHSHLPEHSLSTAIPNRRSFYPQPLLSDQHRQEQQAHFVLTCTKTILTFPATNGTAVHDPNALFRDHK